MGGDDDLAKAIGLTIEPYWNLPDLMLADLGPADPLLVFVEVVASAGPARTLDTARKRMRELMR